MSAAHIGSGAPAAPGAGSMLANFAAFQVGWFACVLSAAYGWPWAGTLTAAAIVAAHVYRAPRPLPELKLIGIALLLGVVCDSLLFSLGWLDFKSGVIVPSMAPHWILAMWALFATTLNVSLAWIKGRLAAAVALGTVGGPLAYWAGARLDAVVLAAPVPALIGLGVVWALATPLLALAARRHDGIKARG